MNWEEAKTECASLGQGSQLVFIKTIQESRFVKGIIFSYSMKANVRLSTTFRGKRDFLGPYLRYCSNIF